MNNDWQDGKLVLLLRAPEGPGYPDRLLLQPLGVAVAGPGADLVVPGVGHTDLRDIGREGVRVDFGQVEVTGPWVREILDELVRSQPDIDIGYRAGTEGIVVMDLGPDVRDYLLDVFRKHTGVGTSDLLEDLLGDLRGALNSADRPMLKVAVCSQHGVPEICPFQH